MTTAEHAPIPEGSPSPTPPPASSSPSPSPGVRAPRLGVRPTPSTSTESDSAPSPDFGSTLPPDPLDDPRSGTTPSASETGQADKPLKLKKKPIGEVISGLVIGLGITLNQRLTATDFEEEAGVWLLREDEAAEIADPLASIANRHAGGTLVNPDMGDLIAAGLAGLAYLGKNAILAFQIRRAVRRAQTGGIRTAPPEESSE